MFEILELAPPFKMLEFWYGNFGISTTFEDTRILEGGILELALPLKTPEFWNWNFGIGGLFWPKLGGG